MEMMKVEAEFRLDKDVYGDRKRTTIVIAEDSEGVSIGVKTVSRIFSKDEDGNICVSQMHQGNVEFLNKSDTIGCFFNKLKEIMDNISEIVDKTGDKA